MERDSFLAKAAISGLALLLMMAAAAAQSANGPPGGVPIPPPPAHPNLENLAPGQADARMQAYLAALQKWRNGRLAALRAASGQAPIVVPPRPPSPDLRHLTPEQKVAAQARYQEDIARWIAAARKADAAEIELKREAGILPDESRLRRDEASPVPMAPAYSWRQEAEALGFRPATLAQLDRESIAIAGPYYKQSFAIYTTNAVPPFITSDSLLNAFNVLFEDSVRRWELARIPALRAALEDAWKGLDGSLARDEVPRPKIEPFARQLAYVIGPALRLLGSRVPLGGAEVERTVAAEMKKIEAASDVSLPTWLGPPDQSLVAIDYRRCRPIGFYASDPALARYYAAVRWLQSIPFRSSRATEAGAAALLACLARSDASDPNRDDELAHFVSTGAEIFGPSDEPAVTSLFANDFLSEIGRGHRSIPDAIARFRTLMAGGESRVSLTENQSLRFPPAKAGGAAFWVLPPSLLPDAAWFAQVDRWRGEQALPSGAELGAWLGSPLGTAEAARRERPGFEALAQSAAAARRSDYHARESVPGLYYGALAVLFEPPDPAAPDFMRGEAWQRKSLQTALSGWAQFRHTWELQAKFDELYFGVSVRPSGFVEPNPEFFRQMGGLAGFILDRLADAGVFYDFPSDPDDAPPPGQSLWHRWHDFEMLTARLEALSQKQLRGLDWDPSDAGVLKDYGRTIGNIMGYEHDAVESPKDDAPRWTAIAHDPVADRNLAVAIGRPRALYVLYPWKGARVLCCGAVMSYYEYAAPGRLTDQEWKARLDADPPPRQPGWIQPLLPALGR